MCPGGTNPCDGSGPAPSPSPAPAPLPNHTSYCANYWADVNPGPAKCIPCNANTPCQNGRPCWGYSDCKPNPDGGSPILCGETPDCSPHFRNEDAVQEYLTSSPSRASKLTELFQRYVVDHNAVGGAIAGART